MSEPFMCAFCKVGSHQDCTGCDCEEPSTGAAPALRSNDTFWVVERKYLNGNLACLYWDGGSSRQFTPDIHKAVQFCRQQDAERIISGWHWNDVEIVEHGWMAAPASEPPRCKVCGNVGCSVHNPKYVPQEPEALRYLMAMRDGIDTDELHCMPLPVTSSWLYMTNKAIEALASSSARVAELELVIMNQLVPPTRELRRDWLNTIRVSYPSILDYALDFEQVLTVCSLATEATEKALTTEREMHNAWRKRANEAEAQLAVVRETLIGINAQRWQGAIPDPLRRILSDLLDKLKPAQPQGKEPK